MAICENTIEFSLTLRDLLSFENWRGGAKGIRGGGIAPLPPPLATALAIRSGIALPVHSAFTLHLRIAEAIMNLTMEANSIISKDATFY